MAGRTPEELLLEYLDRKDRGDPIAFDAFCGEHSGQAAALRALFKGWELAYHRLASGRASLAERIGAMHHSNVDPNITLDADAVAEPVDSTLLEALKSRGPSSSRYSPKGEVAQGGMGVILRVWDQDLRRHLAMKVMLDERAGEPSRLSRFLEEAQVTGQLDHPGIVPVHELGIDAQGRVFFTMKFVKGITLAEVLDAVASNDPEWSRTRALSVVLRVCEAMAFAHDKGVIHRDLKPANVMVGKFGETYVMDWGLARVIGRTDAKDLRIRPDASVSVRTERRAEKGSAPDSPIYTMDGDVVGTPAYMPPEQAMGDLDRVGPQSDVYAVGAILYHLLTGRMPYVEPGAHPPGRVIVEMVRHAPPAPVHSLTKDVPAELEAICEKAMARRIEDRYPTMGDLARDLRAFLEQRVVSAYETGAIAEIRKWVVRNKALAAAAAALVLVLVVAIVVVSKQNVEVTAQRNVALARKAEFDQLAGVVLLDDATNTEAKLYPAWPEQIPAMEKWLTSDARNLEDLKPMLAKTLADLEGRALPRTDGEAEVARLEPAATARRAWRFEKEEDRFLHDTLAKLSTDIAAFEGDAKKGVEQRLAWAKKIGDLTLHHPNARVTWDDARASIAKADGVVASSLYRGSPIDLKPQMGLVPIGMNPTTKLWEFYELRSACDLEAGEDPARVQIPSFEDDDSIDVKDATGIVLVLIPGGTFLQGAQPQDQSAPNFDPWAKDDETPQQVTLSPYFLARHEVTRGQWKRITDGGAPSADPIGASFPEDTSGMGWTHPVDTVSWDDCTSTLARVGLALPTEAQWERGARGGTSTVWWTGDQASSLRGAANLLDQKAERVFPQWGRQEGDFDDEFVGRSPVGRCRANAFGLFDVHGNVWEWCADLYSIQYATPRSGDGLRDPPVSGPALHVHRGGGFINPASVARSAVRTRFVASFRDYNLGLRAARVLH